MQIIEEFLYFCDDSIYHIPYNIDSVLELKHVQDCIYDLLSKCDRIDKNVYIGVLGVLDVISLMVIDGNVQNLVHEKNILKVGFLKLLSLGQLHEKDAEKDVKPVDTNNGEEVTSDDKIK